jgi:membrane-anchored mycosin MYCP
LTARQVIQRIESTAHHPPAGWDPVVGNGTIDPLAAVSTDTAPQAGAAGPKPLALPAPVAGAPPDRRQRDTAFGGTALCLVALVAVAASLAFRRLGSRTHRVAGE